ncbi:PHD finger protein ING1 [Cornus florida]|uniref:PHD finger protein ING1 n=1 Tax=Cornus florida TaxID=4283 RepID=UPI0028A2904E|nr:PHD finger protein ING1 [Cornus florida]
MAGRCSKIEWWRVRSNHRSQIMSFLEDFQANLESLPNILQRKYALLRDLDKSLQEIQRQNEQHCEQEVEDIKQGIKAGNITPNATLVKFSDEALDEQKHAIRIADEKVALAVQAYDLVDAHVQQLDQYLRKFDEELRRERENVGTAGLPVQNLDGNVKSGRGSDSSKGGRKKTRLNAAAAAAVANPTSMDLDLPVDPNEPTYCLCNQVSYGEMVACDNPDCKIEWFHFGCVGLKEQPRGKWYCSDCAGNQKRRKGK